MSANLPAAHIVHSEAPGTAIHPAAHGIHAEAAPGANRPAGQSAHCVCAASGAKPASHTAHAPERAPAPATPFGGHGTHAAASASA